MRLKGIHVAPIDDYEEELKIALTRIRGGVNAGNIARKLLSNDRSGCLLVGLTIDAEAITYERVIHSLCAMKVETADTGKSRTIGSYRLMWQVEAWVQEEGAGQWAWIHPRFRWVFV